MRKENVAIIGMGVGGSIHVQAFNNCKFYNIIALADNGSKKSNKFSRKYNLDCKTFDSIDEMFIKCPIDIVSIATPPNLHIEIIKKCLDNKKKILCEKPVGTKKADLINLKNYIKEKENIHLFINYLFRFDSSIITIKNCLNEKVIGKIKEINIKWNTPKRNLETRVWKLKNNSILIDRGCHVVDYLIFLLNDLDIEKKKIIESYNEANLFIRLKNGTLINCEMSCVSLKDLGHSITISGTKGIINSSFPYPFNPKSKQVVFMNKNNKTLIKKSVIDYFPDDRIDSMTRLISSIANDTHQCQNFSELDRAIKIWSILNNSS